MKAYGVPWMAPLKVHPLLKLFCGTQETRGFVSKLYGHFLEEIYLPLAIDSSWQADIADLSPDFDWDEVWLMVMQASRNPDHQQIHLNFIHSTNMTPRKLHSMKLKSDPKCTLCDTGEIGTFFHMVWDCPGVNYFWNMVKEELSTILNVSVPLSPSVFLLNDFSEIQLNKIQKRVFLAGLTAAKKIVAIRWKPPHSLNKLLWIFTFIDIVYLEMSTARIHGAREDTIKLWAQTLEKLKVLIC